MSAQSTSDKQASRSAAAIVGLVVGIIALATSFLPFINNVSFFIALVGVVFALVGLVGTLRGKHAGKGLAIASLVINVLAIVLVLATQSAYSSAIDNATVDTSDGTAESQNVTNTDTSDDQQADSETDDSKYTIVDEQLTEENYLTYIKGTFTNTSGKELSYVQLSYTLYDADGSQIGTAYANTTNLADGTSWKYEAMTSQDKDDIASFKLADVTAY